MHYGEIKPYDIANGEGVRVSLWVSGCDRHCKGCFNESTDEKLKEEIENGDFRKYMNEPTNELIGDNDNMDARR